VVGLWLLKPWGRRLYVASVIFGLALYPFMGSTLVDPVTDVLDFLSSVCTGAILGILYWSDARSHFDRAPRPPLIG
jgi:hypothetical protein